MTAPESLSFERAYEELGEIVNQLESGDLPLDETLQRYARGRALIALCQQQIDDAELKISQLNGEGGLEPINGDRL
jgi:exodeoxyribonuclease VII small subunit